MTPDRQHTGVEELKLLGKRVVEAVQDTANYPSSTALRQQNINAMYAACKTGDEDAVAKPTPP